jgi:hypothetical protein
VKREPLLRIRENNPRGQSPSVFPANAARHSPGLSQVGGFGQRKMGLTSLTMCIVLPQKGREAIYN